jgi:hypothetical protein
VRVPQQLQVLNLALDAAGHVAADELLPGDDLEGDLLAGAVVDGQPHLAKGALAQGPDDGVGANPLLRLGLVLRLVGSRHGGGRIRSSVALLRLGLRRRLLLLLLVTPDVGGRHGDGQLLIVEASRDHGERHEAGLGPRSLGGGEGLYIQPPKDGSPRDKARMMDNSIRD